MRRGLMELFESQEEVDALPLEERPSQDGGLLPPPSEVAIDRDCDAGEVVGDDPKTDEANHHEEDRPDDGREVGHRCQENGQEGLLTNCRLQISD